MAKEAISILLTKKSKLLPQNFRPLLYTPRKKMIGSSETEKISKIFWSRSIKLHIAILI